MSFHFSKALMSCVAALGLSTSLGAAPTNSEKHPNFAFAYPKDLNLTNPRDFYFYAEGLAFQAMETGLDFAIVDNSAAAATLDGSVGGFGQNESWDYNPGVRVGLGVYLDHDAWSFDLDWMWVNVTNSESYQAGTGATIPLLLADNGDGTSPFTTYGSTGANWGCTFNVVDAALGKPYHVSRKLILSPHFGLRFAQIDQDYSVNYGSTTPANRIKYKADNDFIGVGGRVGVDADWILGCGFKIFSNLSSSVLAGWFDNSQNYNIGTDQSVALTNKPQVVVPNLDLALGFDWGTKLDNCNFYLDFRAGYEFQIWWDQWNQRQFVTGALDGNFNSVPTRGDLVLNGFTFKIQLDM